MRHLRRKLFWATVLMLAWAHSPWIVAAEEDAYVSRMYEAMEWCLPSDRVPEPATVRESGNETMFVTVGTLEEFALLTVAPNAYLEVVNVKHPDAAFLRISFPMPKPTDSDVRTQERKLFWQLATGCFALTQPPR